jgi:CubicO group peptidase (beta-lactamase class C family)
MLKLKLVFSIAVLGGLVARTGAAELDETIVSKLTDQALSAWDVPGAAVVVVSDNRVLYLGGRGCRAKGKPELITADTVFPLASCTKAFTTTLMAMLADEGKLGWDDPVRKHLKTFHLSEPLADADVRLRDLVSHRTGVAGHDLLWYKAPWGQDEQIRRVGLLPLSRPFRSAMQYQTIMFVAAGKAAANAAGQPWEQLIENRLFKPLGMKSAGLRSTEALKRPDHAAAHRKGPNGVEEIPWYDVPEPNPAGSIHASARDLVPWLQLHLNQGKFGEEQLVSAKNLQATHEPQIVIAMDEANCQLHPLTQQMSYGMAWVIQDYRGELLVSHAGLIDGFRAHLTLLPKRRLGLAILANLDQTRMNLALSNTLVDRLLDAPAKDWNDHYRRIVEAGEFAAKIQATRNERARRYGTKPSLPLQDFVGTYENPAYGTAVIRLIDGGLQLEWSSFRAKLEHYQDDTFRIGNEVLGRSPLMFHVADGKNVEALTAIEVRFARK